MKSVIVIDQNLISGKYRAVWLSQHGGSHGVEATGRDPVEALENLIAALRENDDRLAMLAAIDYEEDP